MLMKKFSLQITAAILMAICIVGCARGINYHLRSGGHRVRTGLENYISSRAAAYKGKKAALVTNHSGYDFDLRQNIELFREKGIVVTVVLAPEHGIYGFKNEIDYQYGWYDWSIKCTVYNLFSTNQYVLQYLFRSVDIIIFDIQDMGMRCFTYITNLKNVMDALEGMERELIVLDRPDPVGFIGVDGPFLEGRFATKWVSAFPATFLYNMTVGESARYYRGEFRPGVKLTVVPMSGYSRNKLFYETGLPWIPPSPNLPTYESAIVYTAVVLMEGINLSLGRGTSKPFEYIGAPWIEPVSFSKKLDELGLKNFRFKPVYFKPTFSKYAGMVCGGAQIFYTGGNFSPSEAAYRIIGAIMKQYPYYTRWERYGPHYTIDSLAGTDKFRTWIQAGRPWEEFKKEISPGIKEYGKKRKRYLLY
jgi:uncharacterized protein YbbC (DUF1343 family)